MTEEIELQNHAAMKEAEALVQNGNHVHIQPLGKDARKKGLTLWTAALFILGEMAGSGILALPNSLVNAGWGGLVMIATFCATSGYSGTRLSLCWVMLEERYEEYRKQVRNPYPSIGYKAYGNWMRMFVSANVNITLFGVSTVLLLLSANLTYSLLKSYWIDGTPCAWILIIGATLTPFVWLGTPKDFWPIAVGAAVTTAIACVMIIIRSALDALPRQQVTYPPPTFGSFFLAFGTILFSYGGASTFPTIQNDMRDRTVFSKSVGLAFIALALLYIPVAGCGYGFFGGLATANILDALSGGIDMVVVKILLIAHLVSAFVIIVNPFCQEVELFVKIPNAFGWQRCVLRTVIMICVMFVAESVPLFSKILDLVGGSTITLLTFVFPPLFYMRLVDADSSKGIERTVKLPERIFLWCLIAIGICGGGAATYQSLKEIVSPNAFTLPCYMNWYHQSGNISAH